MAVKDIKRKGADPSNKKKTKDTAATSSAAVAAPKPPKKAKKQPVENHFFASHVVMVQPTAFYSNEETIQDNKFMVKVKDSKKESSLKAQKEFKNMVANLRKHGIQVSVYK